MNSFLLTAFIVSLALANPLPGDTEPGNRIILPSEMLAKISQFQNLKEASVTISKKGSLANLSYVYADSNGRMQNCVALVKNNYNVIYRELCLAELYIKGNEPETIEWLKNNHGADINAEVVGSNTRLIIAAKQGNIKDVKLLMAAHPRINVKNEKQYTATTYAALEGHVDIYEYLLLAGGFMNDFVSDGDAENDAVVPLLQSYIISEEIKNKLNEVKNVVDRLADAITTDAPTETVEQILEQTESRYINANQIMSTAIEFGNLEAVRSFLKHGVNLDAARFEDLYLNQAAREDGPDALEIMRILIEAGVDVNGRDINGNTALTFANTLEKRQLLTEHGAVN